MNFAKASYFFLRPLSRVAFVVGGLIFLGGIPGVLGDDNMYPPSDAARSSIDFDGRGFLVHGHRTMIISGSIHYPRLPRAMWPDILERIQRGASTRWRPMLLELSRATRERG